MRTVTAVATLGLAAAALALTAAPASAACVQHTPGSTNIIVVNWPVNAVVRDPGTVTVTPTDCL